MAHAAVGMRGFYVHLQRHGGAAKLANQDVRSPQVAGGEHLAESDRDVGLRGAVILKAHIGDRAGGDGARGQDGDCEDG
jgi:hypothetical protein